MADAMSVFLQDRCTVAAGLRVPCDDLFEAWKSWCAHNGRREPGTIQSFGRDLRAAVNGLAVSRPGSGPMRVRHYEGIAIGEIEVTRNELSHFSCRFCSFFTHSDNSCRVSRPSIGSDGRGVWPIVLHEDWCAEGDFIKAKGSDEKDYF